jgi:F-type H+-transporting ATPase subunit epsilon
VRRAIAGSDLARLRQAVENEILAGDAHAQNVRAVMAKLESSFLHRFASLAHGQ